MKKDSFILKNLQKSYEIKKRLWLEEKHTWNKKYGLFSDDIFTNFIEIELLKINNDDLERKYYLMLIYRFGYQNIRSMKQKLAFNSKLDEEDINFIKVLQEANILHALNEIYDKEVVEYILKECGI
ncbi:hypothetical protein [Campylobacter molothri]|uniref:hypothetical protein n=1 Tax=Campylobacter molothri TaxID=1032242 RepID=UPI00301D4BCE|nr:hypothetical protein [Campylobacter sp. RM10534]